MKVRKIPLLFFICISIMLSSCDNGESDSLLNNLSEFAKEFVSTHMDSYDSINIGNEAPIIQHIENALNVVMLMTVFWGINKVMERSWRNVQCKELAMLRL